jgi:ABC-type transporter Mla subunit MlaD
MCEHMAVPSYQVGGRTYLNLSGKRTVTAADTDSVEGSVSEASAVVYGGNVSIEQVKGSADPKVVQLLELISTDSRQMRVELGRVTTQLEEQAKATALQGETLSRVMDQMGALQTATAERIDEIQKAQTTVAEDQKKALARMDAALAKMRAGDTAVVGPPSTPMQPY